MNRREFLAVLRVVGYVAVTGLLTRVASTWRLRYFASIIAYRLPDSLQGGPFELHEAPEEEYAATWTVPPDTARRRLRAEFGFDETFWSQLQAYDRDGETVFEAGNFVYRPDGFLGDWQLHVRLFPTADGLTEIWAHWERNIFTHREAHSAGEQLDPEEGERRMRERIGDELIRPDSSAKTGPP